MSFGDRLGIAGLALALFAIAAPYLWPDKKWVGWASLFIAGVLLLVWAVIEVRERLGNGILSLVWSVVAGAVVGTVIAVLIWSSVRPTTEQPVASGPTSAKKSASLQGLFESDWSNLPSYYNRLRVTIGDTTLGLPPIDIWVAYRLLGDFTARSKFLAFYVEPQVSSAYATILCDSLAGKYGDFIDVANSSVDIVGKSLDDTSSTHFRDMVFSKRLFWYYANQDFTLEQKGKLETAYRARGLSIQFREFDYMYAHRFDSVRDKPQVPNSVMLPSSPTPGLSITMTKLN